MAFPFFMFAIGITTASAAMLGTMMQRKIAMIKSDWPNQRCKPHIQVLSYLPFFPPSGVDPNKNHQDCQYGMTNGIFNSMMGPMNSIIGTITNILKEFNKNIQSIRDMFSQLRQKLMNNFRDIVNKIYKIYIRITWLFHRIMSMIFEIIRIFSDLFGVLIYAFETLASVWNGTIGATARFFCFDENTPITLYNGITKKIKDIRIGEKLISGRALGVMKFTSKGSDMYNYKGIKVAGCHLVKEDDKWIRVEDSNLKKPIKYNKNYIYCLYTTDSNIVINDITFADYLETNNKKQIHNIFNFILDNLNDINNISEIKIRDKENIYKDNLNHYPWCLHKNTLIDMKNGTKKTIDKCKIGDEIKGGTIIGTVKFKNENFDIYNYNDLILTGSMIVFEDYKWIAVRDSINAIQIKNNDKLYYNICCTNNIFYSNGIQLRDFEQISENSVNDVIDNYIINSKS